MHNNFSFKDKFTGARLPQSA